MSAKALHDVSSFRAGLLVIRGAVSGVGKSSLACARLAAEAEAGAEALYIRAADLSSEAPDQERAWSLFYMAKRVRAVVVDDLGSELAGAPAGEGLAAMRSERTRRLLREIHDDMGAGTAPRLVVLTTFMSDAELRRSYDSGIWRRIFDPSADTSSWMVLTIKGSQ